MREWGTLVRYVVQERLKREVASAKRPRKKEVLAVMLCETCVDCGTALGGVRGWWLWP